MKLVARCLTVGLMFASVSAGPIEDWVETSANPEAIQEWLDELGARPLDLNSATAAEIARLEKYIEKKLNEKGMKKILLHDGTIIFR